MKSDPAMSASATDETAELAHIGYSAIKRLGSGTYGKVWSVEHKKTGRIYAAKMVNANLSVEGLEAVMNEAELWQQLKHPHIVECQLYDVSPNHFVFLTELADTDLFKHVVKHGKLAEVDAKFMFMQLLNGLQYMHGLSIAHRDIKLQNIVLFPGNLVKLIDFGLSVQMKGCSPISTQSHGTKNYESPQVLANQPYNVFSTDIWSMGVVLYRLVCGKMPYPVGSKQKMYCHIKYVGVVVPDSVSPRCRKAIKAMLRFEEKKRPIPARIKKMKFFRK